MLAHGLTLVFEHDEEDDEEGEDPIEVSEAVDWADLQWLGDEARGLDVLDLVVDV